MNDLELLREYADRGSEEAFAALVHRHIDWVNSAARRMSGNADIADDVTQAVFILLARKAHTLRLRDDLPAWLFVVTRYTSNTARREQHHRQQRERKAAQMRSEETMTSHATAWHEVAPFLDDAVGKLRAADRYAVM